MTQNKRIRRTPEGFKSASAIQQRQDAGYRHGAYILRDRGESALTPAGKSRLQELKEQLASEPGRIEYRRDLAAFLALMVEMATSNIREKAEEGKDIWSLSPVSRLPTYINGLIKLLDHWPKEEDDRDITAVLQGVAKDTDHGED